MVSCFLMAGFEAQFSFTTIDPFATCKTIQAKRKPGPKPFKNL